MEDEKGGKKPRQKLPSDPAKVKEAQRYFDWQDERAQAALAEAQARIQQIQEEAAKRRAEADMFQDVIDQLEAGDNPVGTEARERRELDRLDLMEHEGQLQAGEMAELQRLRRKYT